MHLRIYTSTIHTPGNTTSNFNGPGVDQCLIAQNCDGEESMHDRYRRLSASQNPDANFNGLKDLDLDQHPNLNGLKKFEHRQLPAHDAPSVMWESAPGGLPPDTSVATLALSSTYTHTEGVDGLDLSQVGT